MGLTRGCVKFESIQLYRASFRDSATPHCVKHKAHRHHVLHTEIWHGSVVLVEVVMVVEMLVMVLLRGRRSAAHAKHRSF